jgi:hypothetical protein
MMSVFDRGDAERSECEGVFNGYMRVLMNGEPSDVLAEVRRHGPDCPGCASDPDRRRAASAPPRPRPAPLALRPQVESPPILATAWRLGLPLYVAAGFGILALLGQC